ncbi:MAG TPA: ankyrin repeat domain-containing protein [Bryobacteraceae bacterium]|jgi:ankyrin repeat protein|nr:ankyrin repeat domain-containing protein [Bryobacteraceae bacterium]
MVRTLAGAFALCLSAFAASNSPVADAAMNGDRIAVQSLIQQKADVNAAQADGATAIQWAAYRDDLQMADALIAAGANIKLANREGATPLYLASTHGSAPMIEKLLKAGADVNQLGPEGETPLMLVSRTGNLDAIRVLLDQHADVNAKDKLRGTTALMWATEQSHPEAVKMLVERGASVGAQTEIDTRNARNNLANTVKQRLHSNFGVLGKRGPGNDGTPPLPVGVAAPKTSAAGAKTSSASEANAEEDFAAFFRRPAKKDGGGLTPLVYAAREDCFECAKTLVAAGADVNQRTFYGWTPLLVATQNRHYKLAQYLLEHGANPNTPNNGGWTPLYLATDNRNIEGGDYPVRAPDMDHLDFIKLLLAKGANVNARICGVESTPEECKGDSTETRTNFTMQWLFEDGATPFLRAAQSGDVELMKLLLAHGADPKIFTAHNVTPLAVASGIGWVEGVTYEWSPEENIEAVKMCLDLGIDPNVADDEGRTALHGAAHKGKVEVIQLLVDHGANLDAHDGGSRDSVNGALLGKTWIPLDWARGLVRVGVQSAIAHPEAAALLAKLMTEKNIPIPPPPTSSICLTEGLNGCR